MSSSISFRSWFSFLVSVPMQIVSSAYTTSSKLVPGTLCIAICPSSLMCMYSNIAVITTRKRYGDSGHPCLIHVSCSSHCDCVPSISTMNLVFLYSVFMIRTIFVYSHSL